MTDKELTELITFQPNRKTRSEIVKFNGLVVGEIRAIGDAFQYIQKGAKSGHAPEPTIDACKAILIAGFTQN